MTIQELNFALRKTFLFPEEPKGQKYIKAVNAGNLGFAVKWHVSRPNNVMSRAFAGEKQSTRANIMFVTIESTSNGDLKKLAQLAIKMGATGETQTEQGAPETEAQKKVDLARKERETRNQETERKSREQEQDQEKQATARQQQSSDRAAKREIERQAQDTKQTEREKKADQAKRDAEQRRRDQLQRAKDREQEREAEPEADTLAKTVAQAAAQGVAAALSKEKGEKKPEKKEKKEQMLSFRQYLEQAPTNSAGANNIAGLGADEPIVRRMKDCSKCKGQGCVACTPLPFIRRAKQVAEGVMRQLKAKSIARSVMESTKDLSGAQRYVKSIRNAEKKDYAEKYLAWLKSGARGESPSEKSSLSFMARQAIRMNLADFGFEEQLREAFIAKKVENLDIFGYRFILVFDAQDDIGAMLPPARTPRQRQVKSTLGSFFSGGNLKKEVVSRLKKHPQIDLPKFKVRTLQDAIYVDVLPAKSGDRFKSEKDARDVLKKALSGLSVRGLTEDVENLDIPAEPTTQTFAGSPVFKVDPQTFAKCSGGRSKWSRWSKVLNLEDEGQAAIRTYANRYPSRPIVLQCTETGDMKFLRFNRKGGGGNRNRRKHALPTPTDGGTGQIVFDTNNKEIAK